MGAQVRTGDARAVRKWPEVWLHRHVALHTDCSAAANTFVHSVPTVRPIGPARPLMAAAADPNEGHDGLYK